MDYDIESNTNAAYLPGPMRSLFGAPRFVHVIRDGRAVIRSLYSKTNASRRPGQPRALFMDHDDARCRLGAPDFPQDPWSEQWDRMSGLERICWHWAKKNSLIREALDGFDQVLVLRFEAIFDQRRQFHGFWELVNFLDLRDCFRHSTADIHELLAAPSNRTTRYLIPPPAEWTSDLEEAFERIAGAEQRIYYA